MQIDIIPVVQKEGIPITVLENNFETQESSSEKTFFKSIILCVFFLVSQKIILKDLPN